MLDGEFLRYKLKVKRVRIKDIATICNCSSQNINYKIKNEKLSIKEVLIILSLTGLKFEEVFKYGK
jgi:hypothetical protein